MDTMADTTNPATNDPTTNDLTVDSSRSTLTEIDLGDTTKDTPADAPTDAPADAPTDAPADAPTDASADAPTDALSDAPAAVEVIEELPPKSKINVVYTCLPAINYSMQQNRIAVIRNFSVENLTMTDIVDLQIRITVAPEYAETLMYSVKTVPATSTVRIDSLRLRLDTNFFVQLMERISGTMLLEIISGDETLFSANYPIDILPFDQWAGIAVLPEMLSAFVLPNNPALKPILTRASEILGQWTGSVEMDEYQSRNPDRVRKQMAAIYTAIAEENLAYSPMKENFETPGQQIRMANVVLEQRTGNCLDLSLLYASCLEAAGIHPLILVIKNHVFAGGWLIGDTFPDAITDDLSFITKRTADGINEITLVEATGMSQSYSSDFEHAVRTADNYLRNENDFVLAVDVKRSRFASIRPLPQRIFNGRQWEIKHEASETVDKSNVKIESIKPYDLTNISKTTDVSKQLLWERKLLDLSLRNNLLNLRMTRNTLQFVSVELDVFAKALSAHKDFWVLPRPSNWETPVFRYGIYHSAGEADSVAEFVSSEIKQRRFRSYIPEVDLGKSLTHIYRSSRLSIEENGANTLYIALGLLKWFETPNSERPRYAPILLLPVEMIRGSVATGFVIRARDEEPIINITLLEMLRQNFGLSINGLEPLPTTKDGLDVGKIYAIMRKGIINRARWNVEKQVVLGIFSFSKFIMWNDIRNNNEKMIESKIVSSLVHGQIEWEISDEVIDAADLDDRLSPADILLPIGADSSQLEAIGEAINDRSYILHGPPGTGKSQTITNIIANALYRGKRVLFVAEKMAALSVVQERLRAIGLAPFCLELHSNRAQKADVLEQLKETIEITRNTSPENFIQKAEQLYALRSELNAYVAALHRKRIAGMSLYDIITRYLSIDGDREIQFPVTFIRTVTAQMMIEWQDVLDDMVNTGRIYGHPHNHPFSATNIEQYSTTLRDEASVIIVELLDDLAVVRSNIKLIVGFFDPDDITLFTQKQILKLIPIIEKILDVPELTPTLLRERQLIETLENCRDIIPHGRERDEVRTELLAQFKEEILSVDADQLLTRWNDNETKWFVAKYFGRRQMKKQLSLYALRGVEFEVENVLTQIIRFQNKEKIVAQCAGLHSFFGRFGRKGKEDWTTIERIIADCESIDLMICRLNTDPTYSAKVRSILAAQIGDSIRHFKERHNENLSLFMSKFTSVIDNERRLREKFGYDEYYLIAPVATWIDEAITKLETWRDNMNKIKDWCQWVIIRDRLAKMQLRFVAEQYQSENLPIELLQDAFYRGFYHASALFVISSERTLEQFKGEMFNETISKYKALTAKFESLSKQELYARLAAGIPSLTIAATQNSEAGILQRCIRSRGRGMSLRKLFDQIPNLLERLCPCMLMSPISVAQYIDLGVVKKFDLVIFDEASQMPTSEAIGAIARGKNVVIVGDPRQLPPTSFFTTHALDEEHIEIEDLESILDDCLALSMPSKRLLWHYRSKHESLIAFSNAQYYNNRLFTFPSPDNIESKVRFVHIDGYYDMGRTRQNPIEAQAVVDEIARRLSDPVLCRKSIGVVTFSSVQQTLIEDLISDYFVENPDREKTAYEDSEPLFVKNLENVQGDERDVILFSVGYGPNSEGKISMNFGPLNRLGGERRLNVAVSRARYEMIVYSSLLPDMIDLNRTSAQGVAGLKSFLEYAQKGRREIITALAEAQLSKAIEDIIADKLRKLGYEVHTRIGSSGYRIDIGIVDEEDPTRYILGILCDGNNYRQAKTARDREIVQSDILRLLGWNICRIWTMDWWANPQATLEIIIAAIQKARTVQDEQIPEPEPDSDTDSDLIDDVNDADADDADAVPMAEVVTSQSKIMDNQRIYNPVKFTVTCSSSLFYSAGNAPTVISQIQTVIDIEAPVSHTVLCRRVLGAWGITRLQHRAIRHFEQLFRQISCYREICDGYPDIFWRDQLQYKSYSIYRIHSNREAEDIPAVEIANGIRYIMSEQISMPTDDLLRIVRRLFGLKRTSESEVATHRGISEAIKRQYIIQSPDGKKITVV
jgi:very-short-patch-repair endonuclease